MTENERVLCLAMVLGDGHVKKNNPELSMSHGSKQEPYIRWKAEILSKATNKKVKVTRVVGEYVGYRLQVTHPVFKELRAECYTEEGNPIINKAQLETLSPEAIAIWYMDDGCLCAKKRGGKIHSYELSISTYCDEISAQNVVDYFKDHWGITFTIKRNKGLHSVRCGLINAKKFLEIVKPYIIESLMYKTYLISK